MMNLTNFLKQIDSITVQYSSEQLSVFIHNMGRSLPEHYRENFLKRLKEAGDKTSIEDAAADEKFREECSLVKKNLRRIDSQEIMIESVLNEEYDDWYDDTDEEFCYTDDSGISDMLEQACDLIHSCMDMGKYKEGYEIGRQLFSMKIFCYSEYYDSEELTFEDMTRHELVERDIEEVALDIAYCAYNAAMRKNRTKWVYEVIKDVRTADITLEAIMQHGDEELADLEDFLPLWIARLGPETDSAAERLIGEAVCLLNDISAASEYAEKYANMHPGLYLSLLESGKPEDASDMAALGIKALEKIPKEYKIRGRVALKTSEYIDMAAMDPALMRDCYFAAYESDTTALSYLRALLCGDGEENREMLREVYQVWNDVGAGPSFSYGMYSNRHFEREVNSPDGNVILMVKFFDGQFDEVLTKGLNCTKALGWTGTFMKQGLALFLLYLNENWQGCQGTRQMVRIVRTAMNFSTEEYGRGTAKYRDISDDALFEQVFLKWKAITPMEPDIKEKVIRKITSLLEKRTKGIMEANRRNYYGECAQYIAALGEAQESMGDMGAKQRLMTSYRDKYSRRSSFKAELIAYGWIDIGKK